MQSKKWTLIETITSMIVSFITSVFIFQPIIFKFYGVDFGHAQNAVIAIWFTIISFFRTYFMRRFFNWIHIKLHI